MLVTLNDVLIPAKKGKYAVGLFNAVNLELARGIIAAAEETGSPVIMGTAEVLFPYGPLDEVSYYLIPMAKKAKVPVVIHLDHGLRKETCLKALKLGFSSIMYDCSTDPYDVNVEKRWRILPIPMARQLKRSWAMWETMRDRRKDLLIWMIRPDSIQIRSRQRILWTRLG